MHKSSAAWGPLQFDANLALTTSSHSNSNSNSNGNRNRNRNSNIHIDNNKTDVDTSRFVRVSRRSPGAVGRLIDFLMV